MARPEILAKSRKEQRKLKRKKGRNVASAPKPPSKNPEETTKPSKLPKNTKVGQRKRNNKDPSPADNPSSKKSKSNNYDHLDPELAAQLRKEDAEIEDLEAKLGLADKKEKKRLHKEYAKEEGYGDDFGEFLDSLDNMVERLQSGEPMPDGIEEEEEEDFMSDSSVENDDDSSSSEDEPEETVMMKAPADDGVESSNHSDLSDDGDDDEVEGDTVDRHDADEQGSEGSSSSASANEDDEEEGPSEDNKEQDTYRPTKGEDIYGNKVDGMVKETKESKYVPPHMRNSSKEEQEDDERNLQETLNTIRRSLNNALNRLSEDTLIGVSQSVARLYASHPTAHVNECLWDNTHNACVARSFLMSGLIPVYAAALVSVHVQKGDSAQLGEYIMEMTVSSLFKSLPVERERRGTSQPDEVSGSETREGSNLMLILCYLYNFDLVHCGLMYDVIRDLIKSFREIDVELLLIILTHCGRSLRSDDPSSLKDIVLEVQKRAMQCKDIFENSSRVDYMIAALIDLKNNKKRQQESAGWEKTGKIRKMIGRVKASVAARNGNVRSSESSLRIKLKDILEAESKGRWWKIGASWEGNQYKLNDADENRGGARQTDESLSAEDKEEESRLLKLAAKYRMNTDVRRSIFCIIMGSADYEDAFEKLVKAGMLKNKTERDTARVLMECCGNEKNFNGFYGHLAQRICEFQGQCKFTFQLAFWDCFKQFDSMKPRKAANLAKLLFALVVKHRVLKLNVLKGIDMTSPEDLSEIGMIFLTLFFTSVLEHFDEPSAVGNLFESSFNLKALREKEEIDDRDNGQAEEIEALYASFTLFFAQVLKASPKYKKGTKFRSNLKAAIKACDPDNFFV